MSHVAPDSIAERRHAAAVAAGVEPCDLIVRDGRVVDVFTGRLRRADVAVAGTRIAAVGDVERCAGAETQHVDAADQYVLPGFVEPHLHIGGSQLAIEGLAQVLVERGTVAMSTCFYEPAFIAGIDAALELLERADGTGLDILLSPFHAAVLGIGPLGNLERFSWADLERLVSHPACVELREWSYGVDAIPLPEVRKVFDLAVSTGRVIGGHLEGLPTELIEASAALGIRNDHETGTVAEALDRIRAGVVVQAREGSGARDLENLARAITEEGADPSWFAFSTDEQELSSIVADGHIDHKLRLAVGAGVSPIASVRMATWNAAVSMGIEADYGAVAPGRYASLVMVGDLRSFAVTTVLSRGVVCVQDGVYARSTTSSRYPDAWRRTVNVDRQFVRADFALPVPPGRRRVRVIGITPGSLVTDELVEDVAFEEGRLQLRDGLAKIAVIDRYDGGRRAATALVRGLGLHSGAVAATVNPGMMNLMVIGVDEADMATAANRVVELGGGIAVVVSGDVVADVALPLLGILTDAPVAEAATRCVAVERAIANELGSPVKGLLTSAGFACLAVSIPSLKICDGGLVRVSRTGQEPVGLEVQP